ncbi:hypothetical protein FBUS_04264 [Fasciolopsis buskii]|uniref:Uncharacterized protein n=1 Tax=Fasciolopsis buskii TaxID=27845 RepID=A0A8E0VF76_9TREM|nr:hypothetical protein FBUS_04264 [Fasciolopsis buski]
MSGETDLYFFYRSPRNHGGPWTVGYSPRTSNDLHLDVPEDDSDGQNGSDTGVEPVIASPKPEILQLSSSTTNQAISNQSNRIPPFVLSRQQQERYFRWMDLSCHILSQLGERMHTSHRLSRVRRPRYLDYQLDATWEELTGDACLAPRDWQTPGVRSAYEAWLQVRP